jgi:hypothetical protein
MRGYAAAATCTSRPVAAMATREDMIGFLNKLHVRGGVGNTGVGEGRINSSWQTTRELERRYSIPPWENSRTLFVLQSDKIIVTEGHSDVEAIPEAGQVRQWLINLIHFDQ